MKTLNTTNLINKGGVAMDNKLEARLAELEARLAAAIAENDFEVVAWIRNDISDLKGESRPYDQEWFDDL